MPDSERAKYEYEWDESYREMTEGGSQTQRREEAEVQPSGAVSSKPTDTIHTELDDEIPQTQRDLLKKKITI